jgi:hypothetical protein
MQNRRLSEDDVQKFMQGCEDLVRLGAKFTENIRHAIEDLKKTYEPALKSQYVDKAVVELLTRSLCDFEKRVKSNLEGIDKICTKGGKWFAFYLGRTVEKGTEAEAEGHELREPSKQLTLISAQQAKKLGSQNGS